MPPSRRHSFEARLPILIVFASLIGGGALIGFLSRDARADSPVHPPATRAVERVETPFRTPLVQREEVRFITFDLAVEERSPGGWRRARGLGKDQITLLVGGRKTPLDLFESHCGEASDGSSQTASTPASAAPPGAASPPGNANDSTTPAPSGPAPDVVRYILYFAETHLSFANRRNAYRAAIEWVKATARPTDEAMIVIGGRSLRIVRPMLPISQNLIEDIEAARGDFGSTDMWENQEESRLKEIRDAAHTAGYYPAKTISDAYAGEAEARTRHALENMTRLMTLFEKVEGTNNLILFSDTLRFIPGRIYALASDLSDTYAELRRVTEAANERDVRIYPVHATGLTLEPSFDSRADDALTMLASETGGRVVERTNRLGMVFDRVAEDVSCSYRVGFHFRPRYSGGTHRIEVRVAGPARGYRLRHRRSVDDPTPEAMETDSLTAAMLEPSAAREFPVSVRAVPILSDAAGSRVRIEVIVPVDRLLALPDPNSPSGTRRLLVQIGGRIVPQRDRSAEAASSPDRGAWAFVDTSREALGFAGQAQITLPPASPKSSDRVTSLVRIVDVIAPAGMYRVVAVVEDRQTGTVSAGLADFHAGVELSALGPVGLALDAPHSVLVRGGPEEAVNAAPRGHRKEREISFADSELPAKLVVSADGAIEAGRDAEIYYSVCGIASGEGTLGRQISCDDKFAPIDLEARTVPAARGEDACALVVEKIPAASLTGDDCEFTVSLAFPGRPPERRAFTLHIKY